MPRGFKRDRAETEKAFEEGRITDKRSFIGRAPDGTLHDLLAGEDKSNRRRAIMELAQGTCQGCAEPHFIGTAGEWDHYPKSGLSGRCDCTHNGRWVCFVFHRERHVHVRFGERQ